MTHRGLSQFGLLLTLAAKQWPKACRLVAAFSVVVFVVVPACRSQKTLNEEHYQDLERGAAEPLKVVDYLPPPGVPGVPKNMQPYFFFNQEISSPEALELAVQEVGGDALSYSFEQDFDNAGIAYFPSTVLYPSGGEDAYVMDLESPESVLVEASDFSLDFPDGLLFNMSTELKCTEFGGSGAQAKLLNTYFIPGVYPLWIMVAEGVRAGTSFPTVTNLYIGPGYIRSSGTYRIYRHVGFSTVFRNVRVDADGHFVAASSGAFFPLDTPDAVVLTYMVDIRVEGSFEVGRSPARIRDFSVSGIFPTRSLLLLSNESESYSDAVNMLNLNVDLNENGVEDSCTFKAESYPEEIPFEQFDP